MPDVFDTLVFEHRPYQEKVFTVEEGIREIRDHAGTQFDPGAVEEFIRMMGEEPELADAERLEALG